MKQKVIKMGLNPRSIENAIKEVKAYQKWLTDKANELVNELAKQGLEVARYGYGEDVKGFNMAEYAGTNDVTVYIEEKDGVTALVAVGNAVLFIEFGTGVTKPDNHPEKPAGIAARGTYGKGHGKRKVWGFYGENTGNAGWFATVETKSGEKVEKIPHVVLTRGNEASMTMYKTAKYLREIVETTAKRVFK